jgi:hypothetical protein
MSNVKGRVPPHIRVAVSSTRPSDVLNCLEDPVHLSLMDVVDPYPMQFVLTLIFLIFKLKLFFLN